MHVERVLIALVVVFFTNSSSAQKFVNFSSEFSLLEKNTLLDSTSLVIGTLTYDLNENKTSYTISFPELEYWEVEDSVFIKYDSTYQLISKDTIGGLSQYSIFKKILTGELNDFGLDQAGFEISDVSKDGDAVIFRWKPVRGYSFIKEILSRKSRNNLSGVIIIDDNGKEISKMYYENYKSIKGIEVPTVIKSQLKAVEENKFTSMLFRNMQIE